MSAQKKHLKFIFYIAIIIMFALSAMFLILTNKNSLNAHALDTGAVIYHHFDNPTAIASDGNSIYIANNTTIYRYAFNSTLDRFEVIRVVETLGRVEKLIVDGGRFFVLEQETEANRLTIAVYSLANERLPIDFGSAPAVNYNAIAIIGSRLFATAHTNELFEFSIGAVNLAFERIISITDGGTSPVQGLLSIGNSIYIARIEIGNLVIRRFSVLGTDGIIFENSLDLGGNVPFGNMHSFNNEIIILSGGRIFLANNLLLPPAIALQDGTYTSDLVDTAVLNNRIYKLLSNGTLSSFAVENRAITNTLGETTITRALGHERILIASRSNIHGFFDSPLDTASSGGRIFIADRHNNRLVIKTGQNQYTHLDLGIDAQPISVTARYGMLFVAYNQNRIRTYNIDGANPIHIQTVTFSPYGLSNIPIAKIRLCSRGDLFVLSGDADSTLWRYTTHMGLVVADSLNRTAVGLERVAAVSPSLHRPYVYVALEANINNEHNIVRLNADNSFTSIAALQNIEGLMDIAADTDGGVYVLKSLSHAIGYSLNHFPISTINGITNHSTTLYSRPPSEKHSDRLHSPSRIHLSGADFRINSEDTAIAHRDILITDSFRHRIWQISASTFGIYSPFVYGVNSEIFDPYFTLLEKAEGRIIHTLTNRAPLWLNPSDVFPLIRRHRVENITRQAVLPIGYYVILPFGINLASDFTFVIADNIHYHEGQNGEVLFAGYIRTSFINETPRIHTNPAGNLLLMADADGATVYKFPTYQFPVFQKMPYRTVFQPLDFTFVTYQQDTIFGYFDNRNNIFARPNNTFRWLRISFECELSGNTYEGFVLANSVIPYQTKYVNGGNRDPFIPNATVRIANFDPEDANGAMIFAIDENGNKMFCENGKPISHYFVNYIRFTNRVMVIGSFDSSREYHRIMYNADFGRIIVYIRTENISYDGIDILMVLIVVLSIITLILTGLAIGRYLVVKKTFAPKQPAENFI